MSLIKRGRFWWWYEEAGKSSTGKRKKKGYSLRVTDYNTALRLVGDRLKDKETEETGILVEGYHWDTFELKFLERFLAPIDRNNYKSFKNAFRLFKESQQPVVLSDLKKDHAEAFVTWLHAYISPLKKKPLKKSYIRTIIKYLHAAFEYAKEKKKIASNIFDSVDKPPEPKPSHKHWNADEAVRIERAAKAYDHPYIYLMVLLSQYQGFRLEEITHAQPAWFDLKRRVLKIGETDGWLTKSRRDRKLGIHPRVMAELKRSLAKREAAGVTSPYLFPGKKGGPRYARAVIKLFNRVYKAAGATRYTGTHVGRHTFATYFPGHISDLQEALGHSDLKTTMVYKAPREEALKAIRNLRYG